MAGSNATTSIFISKYRPNAEGLCSVSIRVTFERKKKYYPTPIILSPGDFEKVQGPKPLQNAYIEQFNRTYGFDAYLFESLEEIRILSVKWQYSYNHLLLHDSLNNRTPVMVQESLPAGSHLNFMIEQRLQTPDPPRTSNHIF